MTPKTRALSPLPASQIPRLPKEVDELMDKFIAHMRDNKINGSYQCALKTLQLLRHIIGQCKWKTTKEVIAIVTREGKRLISALPTHSVVANMVRRVLKIIREEHIMNYKEVNEKRSEEDEIWEEESLQNLFHTRNSLNYDEAKPNMKPAIMEVISEILSELETSVENIATQATDHIHSNELILTYGSSRTVLAFLKQAAKKRKFEVIVAEGEGNKGHWMANKIANFGISTTIICDSSIFAIMSRVNKVIVGTHTVMANGGLKSSCGTYCLAQAARYYSVPFIVCAPLYKLSNTYLCAYDQDTYNVFASPQNVMNYGSGDIMQSTRFANPMFDYVPPELVTLFISNIAGNAPSYVYRLLAELYDPEDNEL